MVIPRALPIGPRAYTAGVDRGVRNVRVVYTEDDIRRALTAAYSDPSSISTVKLGADIVLTKPVTITAPTGWRGIVIDGGGQFKISTGAAMAYAISTSSAFYSPTGSPSVFIPQGGLVIRDLRIDILHDVRCVLEVPVSGSALTVDGLQLFVEPAGAVTINGLFELPNVCTYINLRNVSIDVFNVTVNGAISSYNDPLVVPFISELRLSGWRMRGVSSLTFNVADLRKSYLSEISQLDDTGTLTVECVECVISGLEGFQDIGSINSRSNVYVSLRRLGGFGLGTLFVQGGVKADVALGVVGYTVTTVLGGQVVSQRGEGPLFATHVRTSSPNAVDLSASAPPVTGQVLMATSSTSAVWRASDQSRIIFAGDTSTIPAGANRIVYQRYSIAATGKLVVASGGVLFVGW